MVSGRDLKTRTALAKKSGVAQPYVDSNAIIWQWVASSVPRGHTEEELRRLIRNSDFLRAPMPSRFQKLD
jgi:hypothetical protein